MGSNGGDDDENQPYSAQPSPLPADDIKEKDVDHLLQSTWPFEKAGPIDEEFETQVMNFEGETQLLFDEVLETQVMNFEGETQVLFDGGLETQVMDFAGETHVLDDFVGFDNMDTQLLGEWNNEETIKNDNEESDKTDILCDTVGFDNMYTQLLGEWNNEETIKRDNEESDKTDILCDTVELCDNDSGKACEVTSISKQDDMTNKEDAKFYEQTSAGVKMNFASLRTAALRASGLAARSKGINKNNSEPCSSKVENKSLQEDHASEDNNSTGITGSLVREVAIDWVSEDEQMNGIRDENYGTVETSAARRLFMDDDKLDENEGLEDKKLTDVDEVELPQCNVIAGLSHVDSQEPGDLSQANVPGVVDKFLRSNDTDFDKEGGIIGSIANKLEPDSSLKGTQSLAKKSGLKNLSGETEVYNWDDNLEDEGRGEFLSRKEKVFFDDNEKDLPPSLEKVADVKKNLTKELDEQLNVDTLDAAKATCSEKDLQDTFNVGPDTQMAAEAMEELCLGLEATDRDTDKLTETTSKSSSIVEKEDKILSIKYSLRKRSSSSSCEDLTNKSKHRKKSGTDLSKKVTVSTTKQIKTAKERHKDLDKSVISPSNGQGQVPSCTPVASRTRRHCVTRQWITGNITCDTSTGTLSCKKGKQSQRKLSDNGDRPIRNFSDSETKEKTREISNGSKSNPQRFSVDNGIQRKTRSSLQNGMKEKLEEGTLKGKLRDGIKAHAYFSGGKLNLDVSPGERSKLSVSTSTTPASCTSPAAPASPICMGDEYLTQSCRKSLSGPFLVKEISSLISNGPEPPSMMKESRKRRDMASVRVLFSHHLDGDIINHQKKILAKLGASAAPSIREATHFVTDKFVRTRNMLEAIAFGKPVVTHLWLESCGEASCYMDEKNYILRDANKEREFGFSLPSSLAHACQRPLLQALKVWITPNTKPGVEILSSLVKAVHGLPVERIGRSVLNGDKIPDDILVLSCEEDYATCLPFLEKGGNVFSSELLLNGIVTQKLEYERHRLFDDHVKKTRSTRWLKRDNNQYLPVSKCK